VAPMTRKGHQILEGKNKKGRVPSCPTKRFPPAKEGRSGGDLSKGKDKGEKRQAAAFLRTWKSLLSRGKRAKEKRGEKKRKRDRSLLPFPFASKGSHSLTIPDERNKGEGKGFGNGRERAWSFSQTSEGGPFYPTWGKKGGRRGKRKEKGMYGGKVGRGGEMSSGSPNIPSSEVRSLFSEKKNAKGVEKEKRRAARSARDFKRKSSLQS